MWSTEGTAEGPGATSSAALSHITVNKVIKYSYEAKGEDEAVEF